MRNPKIHVRDLKHRPRSQQLHVHRRCQCARDDQRNKRSRLEFKQQQLNGKDHARNGRIERRRHSGRGATSQQHLPLDRRRMQHLPNQRSNRSSRLDDRPFRSKRSARSNCNRRRNRFEQRYLRLDPAAIYQHGFHRFGNPMPLDLRRSVLRHHADNQPANDWDQDHPRSQMMRSHTPERRRPLVKEEQIGEQPDQLVENVGDDPGNQPDPCR